MARLAQEVLQGLATEIGGLKCFLYIEHQLRAATI